MSEVLNYIDLIRSAAPREILSIFSHGGCWHFHKILKDKFPEAIPYKVTYASFDSNNHNFNHVVSLIEGVYYDIEGVFEFDSDTVLNVMSDKDCQFAENFKYPVLQTTEEPKRTKHLNFMRGLRKFLKLVTIGLFPTVIYYIIFLNSPKYAIMALELTIFLWITRYIVENICMDTFNYCPNCGQRIRWPIKISDMFR